MWYLPPCENHFFCVIDGFISDDTCHLSRKFTSKAKAKYSSAEQFFQFLMHLLFIHGHWLISFRASDKKIVDSCQAKQELKNTWRSRLEQTEFAFAPYRRYYWCNEFWLPWSATYFSLSEHLVERRLRYNDPPWNRIVARTIHQDLFYK